MLALPNLKKFLGNLKSATEKDDFRRHMRRYLSLYLPDCAFEIVGTNRYTVTLHEATVVSRKPIGKDEEIKYLCGIRVILTTEEEDGLDRNGLDFSIVKTTRNKATSFFLGPGRFANHDCKANARLVTTGSTGMKIFATRDIGIGEEITVNYDDNYFEEGNYECLCKTCEDCCRNGWRSEDQVDSNRSAKGSPETDSGESLAGLSAIQPIRSGRSKSKCTSRPSRSLRAHRPASPVGVDSDPKAPYRRAAPEHERKRVRRSHDQNRPIRVPGDYLTSDFHVGSVPWTHLGRCLGVAERADEVSNHSCPICERHMELYGYRWPKTKKRSRYDTEERVYSDASPVTVSQGCYKRRRCGAWS
jgi:hypothetical protein